MGYERDSLELSFLSKESMQWQGHISTLEL